LLRSAALKQVWFYAHLSQKLIPEATDREPTFLIVVGPAYTAIDVNQVAVPGIVGTALRRTPPVTVVANVAECTIVVTATARKT